MKNEKGSVVVIALGVLFVVALAGFGVWRYADSQNKSLVTDLAAPTPPPAAVTEDTPALPEKVVTPTLNIKELGLKISLAEAPYDDITYVMTVGGSSEAKWVASVYSKDLLERTLEECGARCKDENEKSSCNKTLSVYYYDPSRIAADSPHSLDPKRVTSSSELYVGSNGPCAPSENPALVKENDKLREYLKAQIDKATDRKISG